jgi:hypothetical protein
MESRRLILWIARRRVCWPGVNCALGRRSCRDSQKHPLAGFCLDTGSVRSSLMRGVGYCDAGVAVLTSSTWAARVVGVRVAAAPELDAVKPLAGWGCAQAQESTAWRQWQAALGRDGGLASPQALEGAGAETGAARVGAWNEVEMVAEMGARWLWSSLSLSAPRAFRSKMRRVAEG